jgi:hypothetical protein
VSTLVDYLLSACFSTESTTGWMKSTQFTLSSWLIYQNRMIAPFRAFDINPSDPVPYLLFYEAAKFLTPLAAGLMRLILDGYLPVQNSSQTESINSLVGDRGTIYTRQRMLCEEDAVMTFAESGESKKFTEWVAFAKQISERMWRRFHVTGEEAEDDLDDES